MLCRRIPCIGRTPLEWLVLANISEDEKTVIVRSSNKSVLRKFPASSKWRPELAQLVLDFFGAVPSDRLGIYMAGKTTVHPISKLLGSDQ